MDTDEQPPADYERAYWALLDERNRLREENTELRAALRENLSLINDVHNLASG